MDTPKAKRVCLTVSGDCEYDSRVLKTATSLGQHGYDVFIIARRGPNLAEEERTTFYTLLRVGPLVGKGFFQQNLFSLVKFFGPLFQYGNLLNKAIHDKAVEINADIYHANDLDVLLTTFKAAKKVHAKIIFDTHEIFTAMVLEVAHYKKKFFEKVATYLAYFYFVWVEKHYIRQVNGVVTVCDNHADYFQRKYGLLRRPTVVLNCPTEESSPQTAGIRSICAIEANKTIILFEGIVQENRALDDLVRAMKFLPDSFVLAFLGYGVYIASLKALAQEMNLQNRIYFIPPVSHKELLKTMRDADIGILTIRAVGLNARTTIPNKVFEYIGAGLPIVANRVPSYERLVNEYSLGVLIDDLKPSTIAQGIQSLCENKDFALQKSNLRLLYETQFNWNTQIQGLFSLYDQASQ